MGEHSQIAIDPNDLEQVDELGRRLFADDGTDLTLIREFRKLTPAERLRHLQSMINFIERASKGTRRDDSR